MYNLVFLEITIFVMCTLVHLLLQNDKMIKMITDCCYYRIHSSLADKDYFDVKR